MSVKRAIEALYPFLNIVVSNWELKDIFVGTLSGGMTSCDPPFISYMQTFYTPECIDNKGHREPVSVIEWRQAARYENPDPNIISS
jgi:hypothetical protein